MSFGRRTTPPNPNRARQPLRPAADRLAYALRNERPDSLRELVLKRLYQNLTPAEKSRCDSWSGVRVQTAG
jgi:hypothetical protein